ncbi:MAG: glycosyl hydrolase 53 family protein [Bacteroidales bacterium]|nr:glycosyl hydrolase 53 family protein [Bacteroidales bacterium]
MKTFRILVFAAALILLPFSCGKADNNTGNNTKDDNSEGTSPQKIWRSDFVRGADISWASEMEHDGKKFRKARGEAASDIMDVMKSTGIQAIRLRVWVDPHDANKWSGKDDVVNMSKRAAAAGLDVMIDFHYSDFFTDPSRQTIPAAWAGDSGDMDKMCAHVAGHTKDVLQAIKDVNVTPKWVQIGNETRTGMIWPDGKINSGNFANFATLFKAGAAAAKEIFPDIKIIAHKENASEDQTWWFNGLKNAGAGFDICGLSHYPQDLKVSASDGNKAALENIRKIASGTGKPVMVVEIGVKTPDGEATAASVLQEFMDGAVKIPKCIGVFYWEPQVYNWWKPAIYKDKDYLKTIPPSYYEGEWNSYNMGAFADGGYPSSVMNVFK